MMFPLFFKLEAVGPDQPRYYRIVCIGIGAEEGQAFEYEMEGYVHGTIHMRVPSQDDLEKLARARTEVEAAWQKFIGLGGTDDRS